MGIATATSRRFGRCCRQSVHRNRTPGASVFSGNSEPSSMMLAVITAVLFVAARGAFPSLAIVCPQTMKGLNLDTLELQDLNITSWPTMLYCRSVWKVDTCKYLVDGDLRNGTSVLVHFDLCDAVVTATVPYVYPRLPSFNTLFDAQTNQVYFAAENFGTGATQLMSMNMFSGIANPVNVTLEAPILIGGGAMTIDPIGRKVFLFVLPMVWSAVSDGSNGRFVITVDINLRRQLHVVNLPTLRYEVTTCIVYQGKLFIYEEHILSSSTYAVVDPGTGSITERDSLQVNSLTTNWALGNGSWSVLCGGVSPDGASYGCLKLDLVSGSQQMSTVTQNSLFPFVALAVVH